MEFKTKDMIALLAALVVIAGFAVILLLRGGDGSLREFSDFVVLIVPLMLGGIMVTNSRQTRKNDEIHEDVQEVKKRVNGQLDAKFDALHARLDTLGVDYPAESAE